MKKIRRYIGYNNIDDIIHLIYEYKKNIDSNIFIDNGLENNLNADIAYKLKSIISSNLNIDESKLKNILLSCGVRDNKSSYILKIAEMFKSNNKNINIDMLSNFITKIICWTKFYCRTGNEQSILYFGDIKKHDIYFLIMLSFLDFEVIYINTKKEDKFKSIVDINEYSECIEGENSKVISKEELYRFINEASREKNSQDTNSSNSKINLNRGNGRLNLQRNDIKVNTTSNNNSEYIKAKDLYEFIDEIKNNKENKFYNGFIGSELSEAEYKNSLCSLSEVLEDKFKCLKITNSILPVSNDEIQVVASKSSGRCEKLDQYEEIFLKQFNDSTEYKNIIKSFIDKNKNAQKSKVENFALKILIWSLRIKDFILSNEKDKVILYFGEIKTHEIYFLKLLINLNVNIIYIYSNKDYNSELLSVGNMILSICNNYYDLKEYPRKIIREVETNAYAASRVVDNILYNSETGMYRPYSLNEKTIKSVILKTTLDEIFILWNEQSKFRSGFKNDDNSVEIPTLFFKLNGVYEDINKYWETVSKLCDNETNILIKQANFYNSNYNNQEFYSGSYLFNSEGFVDVKKLKESNLYKFSYLDKDLQNHIIEKINETIDCECLLFDKDNDFKVRVLMTILDLEERFIKLLQAYNIGGEMPKLILYNASKEQYTKEDAIIIMFMSLMGVDIAMLNPTGYVNIENVIDENVIPKFKLEKIEYDLSMPHDISKFNKKKSFFKRIFNLK